MSLGTSLVPVRRRLIKVRITITECKQDSEQNRQQHFEEKCSKVVKVFDSGEKGTLFDAMLEPNIIFIAGRSITASNLGQAQWVAKTLQPVSIRVRHDCFYVTPIVSLEIVAKDNIEYCAQL